MSTFRTMFVFTLAVLAIFISTQLPAAELYHWVDEDGVQHFTQYRPDSDTPNVSTQKLEDTAPAGDGQPEDVYNLAEHEKRMAAWREEREQNRKDAQERKQQDARQQPMTYPQQNNRYIRPYWYPPGYGRPPVKPPIIPEPPIEIPRSPPHIVQPRGISKR